MFRKMCAVSILLFLSMYALSTTVIVRSTEGLAEDYPLLHVTPMNTEGLNVGDVITVAVSISNLAGKDLYGFDIGFEWNTDAVEYVGHEAKMPVETYVGGLMHQPILEIVNEVSTQDGVYSLACASMLPAEPFNEDGEVFTMTFVVLQQTEDAFHLKHVTLVNCQGKLIPLSGETPETPPPPVDNPALTELRKIAAERFLQWWITVMRPRMSCNSHPNGWTKAHN